MRHGFFVLQCVAVCCSVLQCVAVCCSMSIETTRIMHDAKSDSCHAFFLCVTAHSYLPRLVQVYVCGFKFVCDFSSLCVMFQVNV